MTQRGRLPGAPPREPGHPSPAARRGFAATRARKDRPILHAPRIGQGHAHASLVYTRRAVAALSAASLLAALFVAVSPVLPERWVPWREATALPEPVVPTRPASIPARVPGWAWEMHAWHAKRPIDRGRRPRGAPQQLPSWYWDWRAWRATVSP